MSLPRYILRLAATFNVRSIGRYMIFAVVVGVVAGLGAVLFYLLVQLGQYFLLDMLAGYRPEEPAGEPSLIGHTATPFRRYLLILIPALGGLLAGIVVYAFAPEAEGHGTDAAIDAFHHKQGRIRSRVPIVKAIASALTLGSGGSGGREGPIAQIGAGFGAFLGDKLRLSSRERRILLASGLGAGIGSIFRARLNIGFNPLFEKSTFAFSNPLELGPYTVLALVVALASPLFIKTFYGVNGLFKRMRIPNFVKPAIGGLLAGCIGFFLPEALGAGYGVIQGALDNEIAISLLCLVAVGKIATTSFSIGSGGSGGVFGPSMVIGGALGGAVGKLFHQWIPTVVTQPGAFVIVGMAGFFAAASNAPISTIIMVSEMTGNYNLLVPAMWVCAIAFLISRRWSIYRSQVPTRADSPAHYGDFVKDVLEEVFVRDIFEPATCEQIPEYMRLRDFIPIMTECEQNVFPVVDRNGQLTGFFSIGDVREILVERDLDNLLIIKEIANEDIPSVTLDDNLTEVLRRFTENQVDTLPVVDTNDPGKLLGLLRRNDVTRSYWAKLNAMRSLT
jgi:CIC family chloride channel protein